jgi:hypothetical protein
MGMGENSLLIYVLRTMGDWEQWEKSPLFWTMGKNNGKNAYCPGQ